jgi:hypothetical protein
MAFTVIRVITGDIFEVSPHWNWNNQTGCIIKANGYDAPKQGQPGFQTAKDKIAELLLNEQVELARPLELSSGRLICDIEYNGLNLADYFYEYKIG